MPLSGNERESCKFLLEIIKDERANEFDALYEKVREKIDRTKTDKIKAILDRFNSLDTLMKKVTKDQLVLCLKRVPEKIDAEVEERVPYIQTQMATDETASEADVRVAQLQLEMVEEFDERVANIHRESDDEVNERVKRIHEEMVEEFDGMVEYMQTKMNEEFMEMVEEFKNNVADIQTKMDLEAQRRIAAAQQQQRDRFIQAFNNLDLGGGEGRNE